MSVEWAAGLFEGEGWFGHTGLKYTSRKTGITKHYRNPRAAMSSTDEDVIRSFCAVVGVGKVRGPYTSRKRPTAKPFWTWQADGKDAVKVAMMLSPYLHSRRRARIEEVLS